MPGPQDEPATVVRPIGLLVVHGIGSQKPGASLAGLVTGLRTAYGDAITVTAAEGDVEHARIDGLGPAPVHAIEVFWADLLGGESVIGTFDFDRVFEAVWFPRLNQRSGHLPSEICTPGRVTRWTWTLVPLSALLYVTLYGAKLASIPFGKSPNAAHHETRSFRETWRSLRSRDPSIAAEERTKFDDLMDQVAADVFNYVDGLRGVPPGDDERAEALRRQVREIRVRFERSAMRAAELGCREIQVVAHSLGTVVAFTSMCLAPGDDTSGPSTAAGITRLYTIGSPLEKFRFFWTRLLEGSEQGPRIACDGHLIAAAASMRWDNFFSRLDLVSGRLGDFPGWPEPVNHPVPGLGGLMSSHTAYNGNPAFLTSLGEGLGGSPAPMARSLPARAWRAVLAALQNLALPVGVLLLAALGLGVVLSLGWLVGWVIGRPFDWLGFEGIARGIVYFFIGSMLIGMLLLPVSVSRRRARELHARYWEDPPAGS